MTDLRTPAFKRFIIAVTAASSFMTAFMGSAINIALPLIGKEFKADAILLSWLSTSYLLTAAILLIPVGKLSDIYGRVKFFKLGIIIFILSTLVCGLSNSTVMLLILRGVQGIGSSIIFSTSTAILVSAFPLKDRGKVLGINVASVYTGLSVGPFLGGLITHYIGWRFVFVFTFFIGTAILFLIILKLKTEWKEEVKEGFDLGGSLILIFALTVLMIGLTFLPALNGFIIAIAGIAGLFVFFKAEGRKTHPVLNVTVFRSNKTFTFSNLAALINYSATSAITFLMSFYLQSVKSLTPENAGLILVTQPVMQAIFSPLSGRLSDRVEPQIVASTGMGVITIGLIVFTFLGTDTSFALVTVNLAVLGFGFALFSSPNTNAIMSSVDKRFFGVASSTVALMRLVGQMLSMGIVIVIFSIFIGKAEISPENQSNFLSSARLAFLLFSILCFAGIFASLSRGKIHNN